MLYSKAYSSCCQTTDTNCCTFTPKKIKNIQDMTCFKSGCTCIFKLMSYQYAGHERSVESIEAAYVNILMTSFRERKKSMEPQSLITSWDDLSGIECVTLSALWWELGCDCVRNDGPISSWSEWPDLLARTASRLGLDCGCNDSPICWSDWLSWWLCISLWALPTSIGYYK